MKMTLCIAAFAMGWGHFSLHAQDATPPSLVSAASVDGMTVGLCFSEPMNRLDLDDLFTYVVEDGFGPLGIETVSIRPGDGAVVLRLNGALSSPFTVTIQTGSLSDLAGNPLPFGATVTGTMWNVGLTLADVGFPSPAGRVISCLPGQLDVDAGGRNIGEAADEFAYLHQSRTNNFDVRVRVDGVLNVGHPTAKAGIHIRQSLAAGSPFFMAYVTPTNGSNSILARARQMADRTDFTDLNLRPHAETFPRPQVNTFPVWLRVKRFASTLTAYYSRDGESWEEFGGSLSIPHWPAVLLVGLGTVSHVQGVATTTEYRDFGDTRLYPGAVITITQQPTNAIVEANTRATFNVIATASGAAADSVEYQWQAEAPGSGVFTNAWYATTPSYITPFLSVADSGTRLRVIVSISGHPPVVSETVMLAVGPDLTGPRAISAMGTHNLRELVVIFSEPLDPASAQQPLNYAVAGFIVTNAVLDSTDAKVVLTLDQKQAPGSTTEVQIASVRDLVGHLVNPNPQSISAPVFVLARGFALQELYFGIPGSQISDLHRAEKFPAAPDEVSYVTLLEGPIFSFESFGTRISGLLVPPVSGNYNFFLCANEQGEFWLSADDEPANLVRICHEPQCCNVARDWTGTTWRSGLENRSTTLYPGGIPLVAGRMYYFEALSKDEWGGDSLGVTWQMPDAPLPANNGSPPISSDFLAAFAPPGGTIQILTQPTNDSYQFDPPQGDTVFTETFDSGDGGFSVTTFGQIEDPWAFDPGNGYWFVNGSANSSSSGLISPPIAITRTSKLVLRFEHRYSFSFNGTRRHGGQVGVSINGGPIRPVAGFGFCAHGYTGTIEGANELGGQEGFNADSPGYASGDLVTSVANLGDFNAGDTLQIQFLGAWDQFVRASLPNWLIDRVSVTEGECAFPATFSLRASAFLPGEPTGPLRYQWQRDCGSGFTNISGAIATTYSFVPTPADVLCGFRCVVATLSMSVTSAVARVTITPPQVAIRREGPNVVITWTGAGTLQSAQNITGPWATVGGVSSNSIGISPTAALRFYRVRVP